MKPIHLFKVGTHTSAGGATISFSEDDVRGIAESYDPKVHEAPIVVGHPKGDAPAYGWVQGLGFTEGDLEAVPAQVDPDFAELVKAGRFKHVSASLYSPDSPSNPTPGSYYLRHVGFLGAQPPAIKGLREVAFSDDDEGVVEFSSPLHGPMAMVLRGLREFLIDKFSREEADRVAPSFVIEDIENMARNPEPDNPPAAAFNEPEIDSMTEQELKDREAAVKADADKLAKDRADFAEQQKQHAEREAEQRRTDDKAFVDGLVTAGKILPRDTDAVLGFMEILGPLEPIDFGEGDSKVTKAPDAALRDFLKNLPKAVDFNERSADDGATDGPSDAEALGREMQEYMDAERKAGRVVTIAQASGHVRAKHAAAGTE